MNKLYFEENIHAPVEKVYKVMLGIDDVKTYEQWTAEFNPSSTYEGKWDKGSKILFIGSDDTGKRGGMISEIAENIPNRFVSIRHYGILDGDTEIVEGPEVEQWAGGLENYFFEERNGLTTVTIELDVADDHKDYFNEAWPRALKKLKLMCEQ